MLGRLETRNLLVRTSHPAYQFANTPAGLENDVPLAKMLPQAIWKAAKDGLWKRGIFTLSQLQTTSHNFMQPWRSFGGGSGRGPRWFQRIRDHITDSLGILFKEYRSRQTPLPGEPEPAQSDWQPEILGGPTQIWTDGSLGQDRLKAGCAAVSAQQCFSAHIERPTKMSSTTAELGALLLALQKLPPDQPAKIWTDSQVVLAKLNNWGQPLTARQKLREAEHSILDGIQSLLQNRTAPIQFEWIRGHNGHTMNERADEAAKLARLDRSEPLDEPTMGSVQFSLATAHGLLFGYPRHILRTQARIAHLRCFASSSHSGNFPGRALCP